MNQGLVSIHPLCQRGPTWQSASWQSQPTSQKRHGPGSSCPARGFSGECGESPALPDGILLLRTPAAGGYLDLLDRLLLALALGDDGHASGLAAGLGEDLILQPLGGQL